MTDSEILAHSLTTKVRTKDVLLTENISFSSLILPPDILKGLSDSGFEKPSPIQVKALPVGRCGFDLIVKSKSGTGKTLVFGIISLESIRLKKYGPQVLILAPTREIAVQIQEVIKNIGKYFEGLSVESFIGGLPVNPDKVKCKSCHIAVGTPGRVKQLIQDGSLPVNSVNIFVLDEADKLTEDSFQNDINHIYNSLPNKKQIIMCSATYPDEMQSFLGQYMRSPVVVTVELETPLLLGLRQYVRLLKFSPNVVQQTKMKNDELLKIISSVPFIQCLVFSNYQSRAESVSNFLNRSGWNTIFMSAAQNQTDRLSSLADLKDFKKKILVTTDLASRGIDAPNVDLVVNYDTPVNATTYLHRMGRAGRYGSTGNCINLTLTGQEAKLLQNILGFIGGTNLSIPILDDSFNLDVETIPKENYLFGEVKDAITDFNTYRNHISDIRSSVAEATSKKGAKEVKKNVIEESEVLKSVIEENLNGGDAFSILAELASSGSIELGTKSTEPFINSDSTMTVNTSEPTGSKHSDEGQSASLLLQQLAEDGEILLNGSENNTSKPSSQIETLYKNKALFSVAKVLSDVAVSNEECQDLSAYFSTLKSRDNSDERIEDCQHESSGDILENIFSLAYKSQVSKSSEKWQDLLPDAEKSKLSDNYEAKVDDAIQYEEAEDEEQHYDEDYDFEIEKNIEVNYENNDYSFMEWVPVEPQKTQKQTSKTRNLLDVAPKSTTLAKKKKKTEGTLYYPQDATPNENAAYHAEYNRYYEHCSNNLWQNGLSFDSVQRFDRWFFEDWERQLGSVRNFVQNKIYLEEMSKNYY